MLWKVNVDLDVLQILEVDDIKFTVSFSMYFGVRWNDLFNYCFYSLSYLCRWLEPRIEGPPPPKDNPYVPIDIKFIDELWVPDVYVYFLKQINVLTIFTKFAGNSDLKRMMWSVLHPRFVCCEWKWNVVQPRNPYNILVSHEVSKFSPGQPALQVQGW